MSTTILDAALAYAANGWPVFPVPATGEKKSLKAARFSNGKRWGATTDAAEIKADFTKKGKRWANANIGIPTGTASRVFVLDVDTLEGHGVDGVATLRALEAQHEPLPKTKTAISPTGSLHYYHNYPDNLTIRNMVGVLGIGLDILGEGGMVVAPPSVRPGKGEYRWLDDGPIADAPQWLLDLIVAKSSSGEHETAEELTADPERIAAAMAVVPNDDVSLQEYTKIGMAIWAATGGSQRGFEIFDAWARKSTAKYHGGTVEKWKKLAKSPPSKIGAGSIFYWANLAQPGWDKAGIKLEDFYAYLAVHQFVFAPTGDAWPSASINNLFDPMPVLDDQGQPVFNAKGEQVFMSASKWLVRNRAVAQLTWWPGQPQEIRGRLTANGAWKERAGVSCLNLYSPPIIKHGNPNEAKPWTEHVEAIYPDEVDHIIKYLAHRVQFPEDKINHSLLLGGEPGIGKDTILEPVKNAVGAWNFQEISPTDLFEKFRIFPRSVITRISEARNLGDANQYSFYESMKIYCAAPPDTLTCNEKYLRSYPVVNVVAMIITSNYKTNGLYLPANDRRTYVAWSYSKQADFPEGYWKGLWEWYRDGGFENVAAYLAQLDLSEFDAKAPPLKTRAFWEIVDANRSTEAGELADIIEELKSPPALTLENLKEKALGNLYDWLNDRKNRRAIPHQLEQCGYARVHNENADDGMWKVGAKRQAIYGRVDLEIRKRVDAALMLAVRGGQCSQ